MKRKGFTLIELVIVVAIIGILALMIIPQFNNVTKDAKLKTFQSNAKTVISAIAMYQAANKGDYPATGAALDPYLSIKGGFDGKNLQGNPSGSTYKITGAGDTFKFEATWTDDKTGVSPITYPENK